ncbi:hypothetical protein [Streptomyces sp. NPDC058254]|uniref:hypothetical protein n=1 Tax=Streptomyces sp. NPDC058254 TaxID=3346406 RepID=UPI0036F16786
MIIAYRHADGTVEQVSTDDLSAIESADIETTLGEVPWNEVESRLRANDPTAMRAVLWVARRRAESALKFSEFDIPGWRRRLTARMERAEIDEALDTILVEALSASKDAEVDAMLPHLRKLAHDQDDVNAALTALGKGHLVEAPAGSED